MRRMSIVAAVVLSGCATGVSDSQYAELLERIEALEAENEILQESVEAKADLTSLVGYASATEVSTLQDRVEEVEETVVTAIGEPEEGAVFVRRLTQDINLHVPSQYATLTEALRALDAYRIPSDVIARIHLAPGVHSFAQGVRIAHPNGDRIHILGDSDDPTAVVLDYTGFGGALRIGAGARLGYLDGVTLQGADLEGTVGVVVEANGTAFVGPNVEATGFGWAGFVAGASAFLHANGTRAFENPGDGYVAFEGGVLSANGATSEGNGHNGFTASSNASLQARGALAHDNGHIGYASWMSAVLNTEDSTATDNEGDGYQASQGAMLRAIGATATNNAAGFNVHESSSMLIDGATATDNAQAGFVSGGASSMVVWGRGATSQRNGDGFAVNGNGYLDLANGPVVSEDNIGFGLNVYWGGWLRINNSTITATGNEYNYNQGPWTWSSNIDPVGWGVIWYD